MRSLTLVALFLAVRAAAQQPATNAAPREAVTGAAAKNAQCLSCHVPIAAQLKERVVHRALEMGCEACHIDHLAGGAKSKAAHYVTAASVRELCEGCHTQFKKRFEEAQVQHTALQIDDDSCITCHQYAHFDGKQPPQGEPESNFGRPPHGWPNIGYACNQNQNGNCLPEVPNSTTQDFSWMLGLMPYSNEGVKTPTDKLQSTRKN